MKNKTRKRYAMEAVDLVGVDPRVFRWFLGLDFTQSLQDSKNYGHSTDLIGATVIDEALNVFSKELFQHAETGLASPKKRITTGRFTGEALLGGAQNSSELANFFTQNNGTIAILQCNSAEEALHAAKLITLPRERAHEIQTLKKGQLFLWSAGWPCAVKGYYPYLDFGDYPSAATVKEKLDAELEWIKERNTYAIYSGPSSAPIEFLNLGGDNETPPKPNCGPSTKIPLAEEHFKFLCDVRDFEGDGVKKRYDRLGVGILKGNRLLLALKKAGYITITEVSSQHPDGGRSRKVASLTQDGLAFIAAYQQTTTSSKTS
jgi:hypothetical protein